MSAVIIAVAVVTVIGIICAVVLAVASKVMFVPVDERVAKLSEVLPGANCGGCGFPGCSGMAAAIAEGTGDVKSCKPSSQAQKDAVAAYLAEHPAA